MAKTPISVYLSETDRKRIDAIADELNVSRHSLMQWAVLDLINRYENKDWKPPMEIQMVLIPPEEAEKSES